MVSELLGYTFTRTIPEKMLPGILSGAYQVCGGVIRNNAGQIVGHLIGGFDPLAPLIPALGPVGTVMEGVNAYQLHKLGKQVAQIQNGITALEKATNGLLLLSKGTMLISGLSLAVSLAGFIFLANKIKKLDDKLSVIAKDVKAIKHFLESKERAELLAALRTLSAVKPGMAESTRTQLLVGARQTLGTIHERYKEQLGCEPNLLNSSPIEEYFSITALAQARCAAELDMIDAAEKDLVETHTFWQSQARRLAKEFTNGPEAKRLLSPKYAPHISTDDIIDILDFTEDNVKGIDWIDDLRVKADTSLWNRKPERADLESIDLLRRLTARNRIYIGYEDQYRLYANLNKRPSAVEEQIRNGDGTDTECHLFVSPEFLN